MEQEGISLSKVFDFDLQLEAWLRDRTAPEPNWEDGLETIYWFYRSYELLKLACQLADDPKDIEKHVQQIINEVEKRFPNLEERPC